MGLLEKIHGGYVFDRRVRVISEHLSRLMPDSAHVLDVGAGDGFLAYHLSMARPDIDVIGIDVLVRPRRYIRVEAFDGFVIPFETESFDAVMFVDVLHHVQEPLALLQEAARVARTRIFVKDHYLHGLLAGPTLRLMDRVGNARYGVALPHTYWSKDRWDRAFATLGLEVVWRTNRIGLYVPPARWIFERSLHFLAELAVPAGKPSRGSIGK